MKSLRADYSKALEEANAFKVKPVGRSALLIDLWELPSGGAHEEYFQCAKDLGLKCLYGEV